MNINNIPNIYVLLISTHCIDKHRDMYYNRINVDTLLRKEQSLYLPFYITRRNKTNFMSIE